MTVESVIDIMREAIWLIIKLGAPLLLVSLCVGLLISIFQTVTSIQEQTMTFVPKILSVFFTLIICGNWIMTEISDFTVRLYSMFGNFVNG
ncbi:MAG: flagellar biosynthesis protein FliQ [Lachnospiraceae bacterium]|nr:flagellar biosynthesis protein FliQ [Lachnospiraceae bacterium]